jgi:hypothetical protein
MAKHFLKAWLIGLVISLVSIVFQGLTHTPLAAIGFILTIPLLPSVIIFSEIARGMTLSDTTTTVGLLIAMLLGGSVTYGAIAFLVLRLRDRQRLRLH